MYRAFLSGPITGLHYSDCTSWREYAAKQLAPEITAYSALRGREYLASESAIRDSYEGQLLSSAPAIIARDRFDTERCDVLLVNLLGATKVSIGTVLEIGWADAFRKPIVTIMEAEGNPHDHGMIRQATGFLVSTLDEGIQIVRSILLP